VVYAFFIALFIYRDMGPLKGVPWRQEGEGLVQVVWRNTFSTLVALVPSVFHRETQKTMVDAGKVTLMLMFIIANALLFAHVLTTERIPQTITDAFITAGLTPWMFLIVVNLLLLLGGQFMEPSGLLLIVAPVVFPIAIEMGIDPIHLGIIMVVNMEIGMITPPVGLNLFVTAGITGMSVMQVVRAALPWLGILFIFLIIITYVPWVSTWLPNTLMGPQTVN
jgi:C4-dicarboxylate transporter DctM subunit